MGETFTIYCVHCGNSRPYVPKTKGSIMVNLSFTMGSKDRKDHMKKENGLQGVNTIMKGLQGARVMKYLS